AWDEVREQYYFHRFYSHQPDLNYDNPAVHEEVFRIVSFWMDKGLDGFRLDAIPYLYERDGQGGESLPETIAVRREAWDEVREQYYFHRFYSHQPDLNYDNPAVHEEVF
ncbi:hypothetical protein HT105_23420, partial [Bacteroides fragilis]|nr:hypothetical protein [Bacteroides fragilis]